jgi:uncharacterized protein YkwD
MKIKHSLLLLMLLSLAIMESCKKDSDEEPEPTPTPTPTVMSARDSAVSAYNSEYLGSAISTVTWTGNASTCNPGTISQAAHDATIKRINYFRNLVGLNSCTMDASLYPQEQETALMMHANGTLNHMPPTTWSCYTSAGATGALASNLSAGAVSSAAVTLYIQDAGTGNEICGHRRWVLYSPTTKFSEGSTSMYHALYVWAPGTNTNVPTYIAYPSKGYFPKSLVFGRWSFSIPNANFSSANVSMTGPSGVISLNVISRTDNGYGDNTIVWEPTGINTSSSSDITYTVTVSGITGASATSYTYSVILFQP